MKKNQINNRKDILLLFLYSSGVENEMNEAIAGRTRLMKLIFIFWKEGFDHFSKGIELKEDSFYSFFGWDFGPFSQQVYDDLTFFQLRSFIETRDIGTDNAGIAYEEYNHWADTTGIDFGYENSDANLYIEQEIRLSKRGIEFTQKLYDQLSNTQKSLLKRFKAKVNSTSLKSILRYVYQNYPDFASNSIIKDNILGN